MLFVLSNVPKFYTIQKKNNFGNAIQIKKYKKEVN